MGNRKIVTVHALRTYWEGKRSLSAGLAVEKLEENNPDAWKAWPVLYLDFNRGSYTDRLAWKVEK